MDFLKLLKDRFAVPEPDASVPEDQRDAFKRKIVMPVRLRVLNVVKNWVDKHWNDFDENPQLYADLEAFFASAPESVNSQVEAIKRVVAKRQAEEQRRGGQKIISFSDAPPDPVLPSESLCDELLAYPPVEIARQMTLIESELYRNISSTEFGLLAWDASISESSEKQKNIGTCASGRVRARACVSVCGATSSGYCTICPSFCSLEELSVCALLV